MAAYYTPLTLDWGEGRNLGNQQVRRQALPRLSAARALIDQCGYHRRDGDVQELDAALA